MSVRRHATLTEPPLLPPPHAWVHRRSPLPYTSLQMLVPTPAPPLEHSAVPAHMVEAPVELRSSDQLDASARHVVWSAHGGSSGVDVHDCDSRRGGPPRQKLCVMQHRSRPRMRTPLLLLLPSFQQRPHGPRPPSHARETSQLLVGGATQPLTLGSQPASAAHDATSAASAPE